LGNILADASVGKGLPTYSGAAGAGGGQGVKAKMGPLMNADKTHVLIRAYYGSSYGV